MSKRKVDERRRGRGLADVRIPPWLFYTLAVLFAIAAIGTMILGLTVPPAP